MEGGEGEGRARRAGHPSAWRWWTWEDDEGETVTSCVIAPDESPQDVTCPGCRRVAIRRWCRCAGRAVARRRRSAGPVFLRLCAHACSLNQQEAIAPRLTRAPGARRAGTSGTDRAFYRSGRTLSGGLAMVAVSPRTSRNVLNGTPGFPNLPCAPFRAGGTGKMSGTGWRWTCSAWSNSNRAPSTAGKPLRCWRCCKPASASRRGLVNGMNLAP